MRRHRITPRRILVTAVTALASALVPLQLEHATATSSRPVTAWATRRADPLATVDPDAPLDDLAPLRRSVADAPIVGLGESIHGAAEELLLKHRVLRFMVEEMGFRTVAWEEDWTTGREINAYISGASDDLDDVVPEMSPQWRWREVIDVLEWLREFNTGRDDKVRFVGVEHYFTRRLAYDEIADYVARTAPEHLGEVTQHLSVIEPSTDDEFEHIRWYSGRGDKERFIGHARALHELIAGLPHGCGDEEHAIVQHHARQIVSFYEHYALPFDDQHAFRDAQAAENVRWWHELTGDRIVYWAASAHTADVSDLRIVQPDGDMRFPTAGSHLRGWYGTDYVSIGVTFDHGVVSPGPDATADMPPPATGWFERPLGDVPLDQFLLDLRGRAPRPVRAWLERPLVTRGLADSGPDGSITGGTLAEAFDVVIHRQRVTPAKPA